MFCEVREITRNDLRLEFDAVIKKLLRMPPDKGLVSNRFSGHQRLAIVCMGYDININFIESELSADLWSNYDDSELNELVAVLSNSAIFRTKVSHDLVKTWLAALGKLFASKT
jgi:hypothetical protein